MTILFHGSPLDVYIHWMIFALGIGILTFGIAVFISCRSFAGFLKLNQGNSTYGKRFYQVFASYHSSYWFIFWIILVLHLFMTALHLGLPVVGEPYFLAQEVTLYAAIGNLVFLCAILISCRSFAFFIFKNPFGNHTYKWLYKHHIYFWWFLVLTLGVHIAFGMIHSIHT